MGRETKFTPTKSDLDKVVCRAEDVLGSRLQRHQVCLTKEQWLIFESEEKLEIKNCQVVGSATH